MTVNIIVGFFFHFVGFEYAEEFMIPFAILE